MSFVSVAIAALTLAAPAAARPRRSTPPPPPPPGDTVDSGNVSSNDTSTSESSASCNATVSAATESAAVSSFKDLMISFSHTFCDGGADLPNSDSFHGHISAIAKLLLESKISCDASGNYAYACASTWAGAESFAGAALEAYATSWVDVQTSSTCKCGVDVFASADATIAAWGDIWVRLYNALDDTVCASTGGTGYAAQESVSSTKVVDCIGGVILEYWATVAADVWYKGECYDNAPAQCLTCCDSYYDSGGEVGSCDCAEYKKQCADYVNQEAKAQATVAIGHEVVLNGAVCRTVNEGYETFAGFIGTGGTIGNFTYEPIIRNDTINGTAQCTAIANASATVSSYSNQAIAITNVAALICNPYTYFDDNEAWSEASGYASGQFASVWTEATTYGAHALAEATEAVASAVVSVYNEVFTKCQLTGAHLDPYVDGGCAIADSFSTAYAEACAEAIADAFASINFGAGATTTTCDCDLSAGAIGEAVAHEFVLLYARVTQEIEAYACTESNDGYEWSSELARTCMTKAIANMAAGSVAKVLQEGRCGNPNKDAYCEGACKDWSGTADWAPCLAECTKHSDAVVTNLVSAWAEIDLLTVRRCELNSEAGDAWVTQQAFEYTPEIQPPTVNCPKSLLELGPDEPFDLVVIPWYGDNLSLVQDIGVWYEDAQSVGTEVRKDEGDATSPYGGYTLPGVTLKTIEYQSLSEYVPPEFNAQAAEEGFSAVAIKNTFTDEAGNSVSCTVVYKQPGAPIPGGYVPTNV